MASQLESDVLREVLAYLSTRNADLWTFRQNRITGFDRFGRKIKSASIDGQADISGILRSRPRCNHCRTALTCRVCGPLEPTATIGQRLEIECKSATGKQREAQIIFESNVKRMNGIYILARSVGDVERELG